MVVFRRLLGEVLRAQRMRQGRTLRQVSADARVSLGYISEIERGQKEASSELLASICAALDVPLSEILSEVSDAVALEEAALAMQLEKLTSTAPRCGARAPSRSALRRRRRLRGLIRRSVSRPVRLAGRAPVRRPLLPLRPLLVDPDRACRSDGRAAGRGGRPRSPLRGAGRR